MDWINTFVSDTEKMDSPESYRLWSAIAAVAGALERRVWTETNKGILYPNLFVLLSGAPASGKTIMIKEIRKLWSGISEFHVGPDNPSKASFLRALSNSSRKYINGTGNPVLFNAMSMACTEFSVLFAKNDTQFFGDMTDLYDNKDQHTVPRTSTVSLVIDRPTINILAGVTPDFLADLLPESAWGQGFTSRLMFIYGNRIHNPNRNIFEKRPKQNHQHLQEDLEKIFRLSGEFSWSPDAQDELNKWFSEDCQPQPDYGRLVHYVGRREAHVLKLTMISAASYHQNLTITLDDFLRAKKWLLDAEKTMPDVFRSMKQKSDEQVLEDLHLAMSSKWIMSDLDPSKRIPLDESILWEFLSKRTPSDKISKLIETAYRTGIIRQDKTPGKFRPQPR